MENTYAAAQKTDCAEPLLQINLNNLTGNLDGGFARVIDRLQSLRDRTCGILPELQKPPEPQKGEADKPPLLAGYASRVFALNEGSINCFNTIEGLIDQLSGQI
jgi:hypothetical protein